MLSTATVFWLCLLSAAQVATAAPFDDLLNSLQPSGDVNDFAGVLSPQERDALESRCRVLRERTGAQLAVVVLQSLQGGEVDDFTEKLFQRWGVGQADTNNGVMLLVALDDRQARIEVGYGLEEVLPDVLAGRILREQLFPSFRQQQYYNGLDAAVERIVGTIDGSAPEAAAPAADDAGGLRGPKEFRLMLLVFLFFVSIGQLFSAGGYLRRGELLRAMFGLTFPGCLWLFSLALGLSWLAYLGFGFLELLVVFLGFLFNQTPTRSTRRSRRRGWNSDWFDGSWTGGGWSGGGFGGGFGGGGGSWGGFGGGHSGGGGASGGW